MFFSSDSLPLQWSFTGVYYLDFTRKECRSKTLQLKLEAKSWDMNVPIHNTATLNTKFIWSDFCGNYRFLLKFGLRLADIDCFFLIRMIAISLYIYIILILITTIMFVIIMIAWSSNSDLSQTEYDYLYLIVVCRTRTGSPSKSSMLYSWRYGQGQINGFKKKHLWA